jgi:hypothetical protein
MAGGRGGKDGVACGSCCARPAQATIRKLVLCRGKTTEERKASRFRHYAPMSQFLFSKGKGSGGQGKYGMEMPSPLA